MKKIIIAIAALSIPALGIAEQTSVIETRQAAFKEMKEAIASVKDALKAKDVAAAKQPAETALTNAKQVTELFPEGSFEGDTRAKKKIWKKADDFNQRQADLVTHAEALVTASDSGDLKQLKAAFKTVSKDCKGCHMRYRQVF